MRIRRLSLAGTAIVLVLGANVAGATAVGTDDGTDRPAIPSAGCGSATVEVGELQYGAMTVGDAERSWSTYVPEVHDGETPLPLWVQLHGSGFSGPMVGAFDTIADEHGFVVVGPQALPDNDRWMWWVETTELDSSLSNPDIAFVDALIDRLGEDLCLDLARVYAAGYSAGGAGVSILGCALADRLAAVAPVARIWDLGDVCDAERPVPHLAIHGLSDDIITWDRGFGWAARADLPMVQAYDQAPVPERVAAVATRNGCGPEPSIEITAEGVERWTWACPTGADVELVVHDGGHYWPTWPFDATELAWSFFEQHPMPE